MRPDTRRGHVAGGTQAHCLPFIHGCVDGPAVHAGTLLPEDLPMTVRAHHRTACTPSLIATAVGLALTSTAMLASAQSAPAESPTELDTIIVTAQKRSERIQDVPMSISVVNAEKLADRGQVQLTDYFAQVPGLSMNARGSGRTQLIMRGIATATEQNPTVGVVIDDVPFGSSTTDIQTPDLDPSDLQHIEALRGPQGTLYGASSMGGLLKYVTVDPDTYGFSGRAQLDVSSVAHGGEGYGARAAVNIPVIEDTFALRVSAFDRRDAGFVRDLQQDRDEVNEGRVRGARVAGLWNASEAVTVRFAALAQDSESDGTASVDVDFDHTPAYGKYARQRLGHTDIYEGKVRLYNVKVDADLGAATFDSITAYSEYEHDGPQDVTTTFGGLLGRILGVANPGVVIDNASTTEKWSQEFRLSSQGERTLDWQVGYFYTKEDTEGYQALRAVNRASGVDLGLAPAYTAVSPSTFEEHAVYGDVNYHFTQKFDIQVGGRYSDVKQTSRTIYDGPMNGGYSVETDPAAGEKVGTFLFSPRYKLDDNAIVYGRIASGYRAGGQNGAMPGTNLPETYESDTLVSYETGYKGSFADNRVSLDVSLFYIDWTDIQLSVVDQATTQTYYTNGGKATSKGVETSLQWRPADGLSVAWNASYTRAELEQDLPNGNYGRKGDRLPFSPEFSSSLNVTQDFPLGSLYAFVGAGVTYVGDRVGTFSSSSAVRRFTMPSYTTVDLRAGVEGEQWAVTMYLKNAGDEYGFLSGTARNATTGQSLYGASVIQPRTVGASFTWNF